MQHSHAPQDYVCPFCKFIRSRREGLSAEDDLLLPSDVVAETPLSLALCSIKWWPKNPGHILVVPKAHFENIYEMPDEALADIAVVSKRIALAMKRAFQCDGTSTRQHNEPAGDQDVWHFHQHVFPRWTGDRLYAEQGRLVEPGVRAPYALALKSAFEML